jgi:hypothetical protein
MRELCAFVARAALEFWPHTPAMFEAVRAMEKAIAMHNVKIVLVKKQ